MRHIDMPHLRELQQHLGAAIGICAAIHQKIRRLVRRQKAAERRTGNALDALDDEGRAHQQRARAARADECIALARGKAAQSLRHGAILVRLENAARLVVHGNDIGRVRYFHAVKRNAVFRRNTADLLLSSRQKDGKSVLFDRRLRSAQNLQRGVIAAESVQNDTHCYLSFSAHNVPWRVRQAPHSVGVYPVWERKAAAECRSLPPSAENPCFRC